MKEKRRLSNKQRRLDLLFATRWLGLKNCKKGEVFLAAADALEMTRVEAVALGCYPVLRQFATTFQHSASPTFLKNSRPIVGYHEKPLCDPNSDEFLMSFQWRKLRMVVLTKRGARCECCGSTPRDGVRMHVDHVKPRRRHPELALVESNLQILCEVCNHGKGSWDETDWRIKA